MEKNTNKGRVRTEKNISIEFTFQLLIKRNNHEKLLVLFDCRM